MMTTTTNTKGDQQVDAMALPQPNTSSPSSSTSTTTTQDDNPKTTNSDNKVKVSYVVKKNSTTTLKLTFSKPPPSLEQEQPTTSVIEPMIKNKNANNKRKTETNKYEPPKKRRIVVSSIVEQDGPTILATMIDHVKNTFKGYNINGAMMISDAKIIMERELYPSDINDDQGRLAIPKGKILTEFLNEEEVQSLSRKVNDVNMATMDVKVIIGSNNYDMSLSRWNYKTEGGFKYVLKNKEGQWTKIKEHHNLDVRDMILVATFRYNNVLHFAIHKKRSTMLFGKKIEQYRM